MDIVEAAEILNIRPSADHNAAHDYMSTRTQAARQAEWERLQPKPTPQQPEQRQSWRVGQFDEFVAEREAARKASSPNPTPPAGSTTRPWKPAPTRRERLTAWKRSQPWPVRWLLNLSRFLLILAGRLAVVAGMFYVYAESVRWAIKSLAHGWYVLLIIFPGIMVAGAGLYVTVIFAGNFLLGGWKGLGDFLMDRGHEGLTPDPDAWTRKAASRAGGRTRWL